MRLFVRSSMCILQSAKRMLASNAARNFEKVNAQTIKDLKTSQIFDSIIKSDLIINEKMQANEIMEDSQWTAVRKDLVDNYNLTETNVDTKICDILQYYNRLDEAVRYIKFLERNNYSISLGVAGYYLKIFYKRNKPITVEEEQEIYRIYNNLKAKYPLLDGQTCSYCILALSLTKRWKETFELLDMLNITSNPGSLVMSAIIRAAFRNNEISMGWKIMTETIQTIPLQDYVYREYLNFLKNKFDNNKLQEDMEKMFFFWSQQDIKPSEEILKEYIDLYKTFGFNAKSTTISASGECSHCSEILQGTTLSTADFELLSTSILTKLIVGENVYCATSPQELNRYLKFAKTMKPYDVVIDGLNVAYFNRKGKDDESHLRKLLSVVNYFYNNKKRVLVFGKVHMKWWSTKIMTDIRMKADVFLIKDISQDDPFLLHITLLSGPQTYFVSRDLMRQHQFKLVDSNLQIMFRKWQLSRQYMFTNEYKSYDIKLIPPLTFDINAQKSENSWHIPYSTDNQWLQSQVYSIPPNWFCLTKKKH